VDNFANIADRAMTGTLKTYSKWRDRYGISLRELAVAVQSNWMFITFVAILGIVASVMGIMGTSLR
jgi:hypothetical protein